MADAPQHLAFPLRFERDRQGRVRAATNPQRSTAEIADCVEVIVRSQQGDWLMLPTLGRPDLMFTTEPELQIAQLQDVIDEHEPDARAIVEREDIDPDDPHVLRLHVMWEMLIEEDTGA